MSIASTTRSGSKTIAPVIEAVGNGCWRVRDANSSQFPNTSEHCHLGSELALFLALVEKHGVDAIRDLITDPAPIKASNGLADVIATRIRKDGTDRFQEILDGSHKTTTFVSAGTNDPPSDADMDLLVQTRQEFVANSSKKDFDWKSFYATVRKLDKTIDVIVVPYSA